MKGTVTSGNFPAFTLSTKAEIAGATPIDWTEDLGPGVTVLPENAEAYVVDIELSDDDGKIGNIVPAKYTSETNYSIVQYLYAENDFTVTGTGISITAKYGWNQVCVTQTGATQTITTVTALPEGAKWLLECNRSGVTGADVYASYGATSLDTSIAGTVKIGGMEAGAVAAGKLTFMLPVPVQSDDLVGGTEMETKLKEAAGWTSATITPTGAKAQLWENLELYDGEDELLGTISLGKTVGEEFRNVYFMYFDREFDITGTGGTNEGTFHSSRGWNIFHPYIGDSIQSTFLDDFLNDESVTGVKWVYTAVEE